MDDGVKIKITGDDSEFKKCLDNIGKMSESSCEAIEKTADAVERLSSAFAASGESTRDVTNGIAANIKDNSFEVSKEFERLMDDLDLQKDLQVISESDYYAKMESLRDTYLEKGTKEWWNYTKKIIVYQRDLLENQKKELEKAYNEFLDSAKDKISNLQKEQERFADKLKDYGGLYDTDAVIGVKYEWSNDGHTLTESEVKGFQINDLKKQTAELKTYADNLLALKDRADIPQEFFATLRDLSVEDGLQFTNALLDYDDETLSRYISEWKEKQEAATEISRVLYHDEYETIKSEILNEFGELPDKFLEIGKSAGGGFMQGFQAAVSDLLVQAAQAISDEFSAILPASVYSGSAGGSYTNNYKTTYVVQPSAGESTSAQLRAIRDSETLNKLRNG